MRYFKPYYIVGIILIVSIFSNLTHLNAHEINAFKYVIIKQYITNVQYDAYNDVTSYFERQGLQIISDDYKNNILSTEDKNLVLYVHYVYGKPKNKGVKPFRIFAISPKGKLIYCHYGKGNIKSALNSFYADFSSLHYKYDSTLLSEVELNPPVNFDNRGQFERLLRSKKLNDVDGIYRILHNPNGIDSTFPAFQEFGILKENGHIYAFVLNDHLGYSDLNGCFPNEWKTGQLRLDMAEISPNKFDGNWYGSEHSEFNAYKAYYKDGILSVYNESGNYWVENYTKIYPAYGEIVAQEPQKPNDNIVSTGSGFFISKNIIATNNHVIENANNIEVTVFANGIPETYKAYVLCTDKVNDLALLTIKEKINVSEIPYVLEEKTIDVGTYVFTMGYPLSDILGEEIKVTDGIISSKSGFQGDVVTYQISAPIQPGNSGGALFDKNGHLVGITNAGIQKADNVGYAIKSSYLLNLIYSAPIEIPKPKLNIVSSKNMKELPDIIKLYKPYVVIIKIKQ